MIFSSPENAPPQMKRMFVVSTWRNSCCGCLRPPCGGTLAIVPSMILSSACCTPSPDTSRALDVVVRGLQQLQDDVLDVLTDIASLGERGRIRHRERHVENSRQRLRQKRLARTSRPDQQNVGFCQLDVVVLALVIKPLVVIVNRDREHLLRVVLTDNVIVQDLAYLARGGDAVARLHQRGFVLLADDVHAQLNTLIANENGRPGNELAHLVLALAAERAVK